MSSAPDTDLSVGAGDGGGKAVNAEASHMGGTCAETAAQPWLANGAPTSTGLGAAEGDGSCGGGSSAPGRCSCVYASDGGGGGSSAAVGTCASAG